MANLPAFYQFAARSSEVSGADWVGGCNKGGSNGSVVGVSTGVVNPAGVFPLEVDPVPGQAVGQTAGVVTLVQGADINDQTAYAQATGAVADGAEIIVGVTNETGVAMVAGDWAYGVKAQA